MMNRKMINSPLRPAKSPIDHSERKALNCSRAGIPSNALVVDDVPTNREFLASLLVPLGFEVMEARDGREAISQATTASPDIILLDMIMPVMDGYEATRAIRMMDSPMRNAPIIALTANATRTDIEKCLSSGMNDYLPKPFAFDELVMRVRALARRPATAAFSSVRWPPGRRFR